MFSLLALTIPWHCFISGCGSLSAAVGADVAAGVAVRLQELNSHIPCAIWLCFLYTQLCAIEPVVNIVTASFRCSAGTFPEVGLTANIQRIAVIIPFPMLRR